MSTPLSSSEPFPEPSLPPPCANTPDPLPFANLTQGPSPIATEIATALNRGCSADELIATLKMHPRLAFLYETTPRLPGQYRLDDHSHAVIRQFDKYFSPHPLPGGVRPELIRLTLALHDIGKYIPETTRDQHRATVSVISSVREHLPITDQEFAVMVALIDGDPIGEASIHLTDFTRHTRCSIPGTIEDLRDYCRTTAPPTPAPLIVEHEARRAFTQISAMARRTHLSVSDFTKLLMRYYQCDSSAYSVDGELRHGNRAHAALEYLFELGDALPHRPEDRLFQFDPSDILLRPAPPFAGLFKALGRCSGQSETFY
jgi:hypothetical protein